MKRCTKGSGLLASALLLAAATALAQQPGDSAKPSEKQAEKEALLKKLATPGEHHQRLAPLAGKWALAVKWRGTPEAKWNESKGTVEYQWILGGRFLREEFKFDMGGEPMEWLGIYGYDNFQKKYTAVWVDNMGTNTEFADGQYDPKGKVLSYLGEQDDPPSGGKRKFKWLITIEGPDRLRFDSYDQDPPGKYFKNTEAVAARLAHAPGHAEDAASPAAAPPKGLAPFFRPPAELAGELGSYRNVLKFDDGRTVGSPEDWAKRRQEILKRWHEFMGPWPTVIEKPKIEYLERERRENITQHHLRLEVAPGRMTDDAYLLIPDSKPDGKEKLPAVLVVFYDAASGIGRSKHERCDFAWQLAKRGFVTLSLGSPPASFYPSKEALAGLPQVDPRRIGVMGHSYGGKWAMFAASLWEKFACGVWIDPGIVFDEKRGNVNYWEPWYLGYEPTRERKPGIPSDKNPRTGPYRRLMEAGHNLHELQALMAPRPFLVSGGSEDPPQRWQALNHVIAVNKLLGHENRVAMTNRPGHSPTEESNEQIYQFLEYALKK